MKTANKNQSNFFKVISLSLLSLVIIYTNAASAAKLYKWVDKDGNVSYQDSPPPEGSQIIQEKEIQRSEPSSQPAVVFRQQPVIVYTVDDCLECESLLTKLRDWGIPVSEASLQNRAVQARVLEITDSLSAPTLFIGDNLISDHSDENLSAELLNGGHQKTNDDSTGEISESEEPNS